MYLGGITAYLMTIYLLHFSAYFVWCHIDFQMQEKAINEGTLCVYSHSSHQEE